MSENNEQPPKDITKKKALPISDLRKLVLSGVVDISEYEKRVLDKYEPSDVDRLISGLKMELEKKNKPKEPTPEPKKRQPTEAQLLKKVLDGALSRAVYCERVREMYDGELAESYITNLDNLIKDVDDRIKEQEQRREFIEKSKPQDSDKEPFLKDYWFLKSKSPEEIMALYQQYGKNIFFKQVPVMVEGKEEIKEELEIERIPLIASKIFHTKTYDDTGELWVWSGKDGIYIRGNNFISTWLENTFPDIHSPSFYQDVLHKLKALSFIDRDKLSYPLNIIPFSNCNYVLPYYKDANGRVLLSTQGVPTAITPEHFITVRLPHEYMGTLSKCPVYDNFMSKGLGGDLNMIQFLNEFFGSMLYKLIITPLAVYIYGLTQTGKSTLLKLIRFVLGEKNCVQIQMSQFNETFERVRIEHKLANIVPDESARYITDISFWKAAVSGDPINASKKFQDTHEFAPYAKFITGINKLYYTKDEDDATWQRKQLVFWNAHQYT